MRGSGGDQFADCGADRLDAAEHIALEHVVWKLDVEDTFQRQHHVDAGMRGHAGLVQVSGNVQAICIGIEMALLT